MNTNPDILSEYADLDTVAEALGRSPRTVNRLVRLRQLPQPVKIGGRRLWHIPTLQKFLEKIAEGAA